MGVHTLAGLSGAGSDTPITGGTCCPPAPTPNRPHQVDLVGAEEQLVQVEGAIAGVNPTATIIRCSQARVDLDRILGLRCFDTEQVSTHCCVGDGGAHAAVHSCVWCVRWCVRGCLLCVYECRFFACAHACCLQVPLSLARLDAATAGASAPVKAVHDKNVTSVTLTSALPVDLLRMQDWLRRLLEAHWSDV
jgi:G3E family GTPase